MSKQNSPHTKFIDGEDIVELILSDHLPLKKMIRILKDPTTTIANLRSTFSQFSILLMNHSKSEELSLYEAMIEKKGNIRLESFEGKAEHALAESLLKEIKKTKVQTEWRAKLIVLAELVERHMEAEEEVILKEVHNAFHISERKEIGEEYLRLYQDFEAKFSVAS